MVEGTVGSLPMPGVPFTCPAGQAVALSCHWVTAISVGTHASLPTACPKCPILEHGDRLASQHRVVAPNPGASSTSTARRTHRAGLQAVRTLPAWGTVAGPTLGVAGCPMGTVTAPVAAGTPRTSRTWH